MSGGNHRSGGPPGLPWSRASSPTERTARNLKRVENFGRRGNIRTLVPGGKDAALHVRQGCLTLRGGGPPGLPWSRASSPAERTARNLKRVENFGRREKIRTLVPGGKDAALHVRQGCLTLRGGGPPGLPESRASGPGGKNRAQFQAGRKFRAS